MSDEIVKQHYLALAKLLKTYRIRPIDKSLLRLTHNFCKSLYQAAKTHPDLIFAQPQLHKPQLSWATNLAFNATVFTCSLAVRNKFDPAVTLQLMCGSLSIYALEQETLEKYYQTTAKDGELTSAMVGQSNAKFKQLLRSAQQTIWLANYRLCPQLHIAQYAPSRLTSPVTALSYVANKLALLTITNKRQPTMSFAQAIKYLSLQCSAKWYYLLTPLLKYPTLSPPGSYIRLRDDTVHMVLSVSSTGLVSTLLPNKQSGTSMATSINIQFTAFEQVKKSYPGQPLHSFSRLNQWWANNLVNWFTNHSEQLQISAFEPIKPIQSAPASLLVIQDQLNQPAAEVTVIVKAIEKEPAYAQQLQVSATIMNRKKQPIQSIQHGLAMLGFERTNSLLLQYSLLSQLNQSYFPLQHKLLQFSQFFTLIVSELASKTKEVSPELASTTAYFVVSRLFTLPSIRMLSHWEASTLPAFHVAGIVKTQQNKNLKSDAVLLAKAWLQSPLVIEVLQQYDQIVPKQLEKKSTRQFCNLIGLSLILAQEYYFSAPPFCNTTTAYFDAALKELDLKQDEVKRMMINIVTSNNLFCL
ncbi:HDOD domain-containing protein [uncultured Paraglaciecola sp.]|uniref:HDOD domain-containing protein n=1 Tax=uncultured Paraglaciecola sp. TaxID=1765024 RepID=UPI00262EED65|nr:HDOD domain-containing protein [uncultured Paraglaciecola sp.]